MRTELTIIPAYDDGIIGDARIKMSVQCLNCSNLNNDMTTCKAFKDGIPSKILTGKWNHNKPFEGDNGILFEKIET